MPDRDRRGAGLTGFAGLASLVSDVEPAIREARRKIAEQEHATTSAARERTGEPPSPHTSAARESTQAGAGSDTSDERPASGSTFRWGRLIAIAVGLTVVVLIASQGGDKAPAAATTTNPFEASADVAGSTGRSPAPAPAPGRLGESQPAIGGPERVLDASEIRYCLAEEIRLTAAQGVVDTYNSAQVERFNAYIDDYNVRCAQFKYSPGTLERARADVEANRAVLLEEGRARFGITSSLAVPPASVVPAVALSSDVPRRRAIERTRPARLPSGAGSRVSTSAADATAAARLSPRARENLATCMSGEYPALCDHSQLTAEEEARVTEAERAANYRTCASGQYPALCDHGRLTPDEAAAVATAERRENFRQCSSGEYPALCHHELLTDEQAAAVRVAERRVNYRTCSSGQYPSLCRHELLSAEQSREVEAAERRENYRTCISGLYPILCKHWMLSPEESARVSDAEARARRR